MKLIFEKDIAGEITVKIATGTVPEDFSYTLMIKQLLKKNKFEDTQYKNISADEQSRIEEMLKKINDAVDEDE